MSVTGIPSLIAPLAVPVLHRHFNQPLRPARLNISSHDFVPRRAQKSVFKKNDKNSLIY